MKRMFKRGKTKPVKTLDFCPLSSSVEEEEKALLDFLNACDMRSTVLTLAVCFLMVLMFLALAFLAS